MNKCSICKEEFEDTYFDKEQVKCILHCAKIKKNGWINSWFDETRDDYESKMDKWDSEKLNDFSECFTKSITNIENDIIIKDVIFPIYWDARLHSNFLLPILEKNSILFDNCRFLDYLYIGKGETKSTLKHIAFRNSIFEDEILFHNIIFERGMSILHSAFEKDVFFANFECLKLFEIVSSSMKKVTLAYGQFNDTLDIKSNKNNFDLNINNCITDNVSIDSNEMNLLSISDVKLKKEFIMNRFGNDGINYLKFEEVVFESRVIIQSLNIKEEANLYNTTFNNLANLYQTTFNEVSIEGLEFKKIVIFSEAEFKKDIDFNNTKFIGKSIFKDTVIKGKLNLRDAIFDEDANFLDVTSEKRQKVDKNFIGKVKNIQVENRETARIIKNFFDKSNNIIEANRFYALEMRERRKELNAKNSFLEWIVFYLHGLSSNHSQSWGFSLFWILSLGILYTFEVHGVPIMTLFITLIILSAMVDYFFKKYTLLMKIFDNVVIPFFMLFSLIYIFVVSIEKFIGLTFLKFLNELAININLFSKLDVKDMTFGFLVYKIILSYLIYQFIVSVRQDTRRK